MSYHNLHAMQAENAALGEEFPEDMPYLLDDADIIGDDMPSDRQRYRGADAMMTINAVLLKYRVGKLDAITAVNALMLNDALDHELVMNLLSDFHATLNRLEA